MFMMCLDVKGSLGGLYYLKDQAFANEKITLTSAEDTVKRCLGFGVKNF